MTRFERMIIAGTVSYLIIEKPKLVNNLVDAVIEGYIKAKKQAEEARDDARGG